MVKLTRSNSLYWLQQFSCWSRVLKGEWHSRKHGGPKRRVWRKIHLGIDEETLEIRSVEVTGSHTGDALILPYLWISSPKPRRNEDALYETAWPIADGEGL